MANIAVNSIQQSSIFDKILKINRLTSSSLELLANHNQVHTMSDTPARRTRGSTRTSATPAPSIAASRKPRTKTPKALPAVPTGKSHAYGAVGKVELSTQLEDSSASGAGFAARFRADRGAAVDRDVGGAVADILPLQSPKVSRTSVVDQPPPPPPPQVRSTASKSIAAITTARTIQKIATPDYLRRNAHDSTDDDDDDYEEDFEDNYRDRGFVPTGGSLSRREPSIDAGSFTDLDTHFSYTTSMPPSTRSRRFTEVIPPPTMQEREAARPWSASVFLETLHRRWQDFEVSWKSLSPRFRRACLAIMTALLLLFVFGPGIWLSLLNRSAEVCYQAGEYAIRPFSYIQRRAFGSNEDSLSRRLQTLELDLRGMRRQVQGLDPEAIKRLQAILPEQILVRKDDATGQLVFPPEFWRALQAKSDQRDTGNMWNKFIESNQNKLEQYTQDLVQKTLKNQQILSKADLAAAVSENHAEFQENFSGQLRAFEASVLKSTELITRRTVSDVIKQAPNSKGTTQLHSLALANIARNTELRLRSVNYFSHTLGATVHPKYTSPTAPQQLGSVWQWVNRNLYDSQGRGYPSPARVLNPWEEPSDCWCAAASDDKGKAQIGVLMPRAMRPTSITIEHMPSTGTLDIGAAPKDFEVWVRDRSNTAPSQSYNTHLGCAEAPEAGLICVGKATYDINAFNHIQNFDLEDADGAIGFVDFAVVRVMNNWGQDWTCIYRIRMHGDPEPADADRKIMGEL
jgi:hypothetical protein